MIDLFRAAEVTVSIPRSDSSPRSVWEAMAAGSATVLSDLPWAHELIEDGRHALLVTPAEEAVSAAIERLLADPDLRASITAEARAACRAPARPQRRAWPRRGLLSGPRPNVRRRSQCALCGSALEPLFDKDGYPICRCGSCGLVQVDAAPGPRRARADLRSRSSSPRRSSTTTSPSATSASRPSRAARFADVIAARSSGRLLDVGCRSRLLPRGCLARTTRSRAWSSRRSPPTTRAETLGLRVFTGDVTRGRPRRRAVRRGDDVGTIEHMADPLGAFAPVALADSARAACSCSRPGT